MSDKEDLLWLLQCSPNAPEQHFLEPTIQTLSLLFAAQEKNNYSNHDIVKMAVSGFIAMRARMVDEERFTDIHPYLYFQAAQILMENNYNMGTDSKEELDNFINKIKNNL